MKLAAADIDIICYDFDGVMTDNRVLVLQDGSEGVMVNRGDGLAVAAFKKRGIPQVIVSTETNPVVAARGVKLQIPVLQGIDNKLQALSDYAVAHGHDLARAVYVGNDINDLEIMRAVGFPIAPNDAHKSIRELAKHVTATNGGAGVIRELLDIIH